MAAKFKVFKSWGIASARHTSGLVLPREDGSSPGYFDVPQGPCLVRWDILQKKKLWSFQPHDDAVFCHRLSPNAHFIVTLSYSGEVGVWSTKYDKLCGVDRAKCTALHHVSWSADSSSIAMVGNGFDSRVVVYRVAHSEESGEFELSFQWQDEAGTASAEHWKQTKSESPPKSDTSDQSSHSLNRFDDSSLLPAFETCEFLPSGCVVVTEDCPKEKCNLLHLYSQAGKHKKVFELMPDPGGKRLSVVLITACHNGLFLVGLQGGHIMLFDDGNVQLITKFCIGVTPRTCVWDGDLLLFPSDTGKLLWWSPQGGNCVKEVKILEQDYFVHVDWDVPGESLFVCGFTTLNHVTVKRESGCIKDATITRFRSGGHEEDGIIRGFQISCCGMDFSPSAEKVAVGDLASTVWVCPVVGNTPLLSTNVGMSVRCLLWLDEEHVVVGTLDGLLHLWNVSGGKEPLIIQHLEGSVLHMRWANHKRLLAVGTSHGQLLVYDWRDGGQINELVHFCAHKPKDGKQNPLFGQLGKQAEIWSLCWSPDDDMVVTCSEDQTSKIWDTTSWNLVTTLVGHKMAVTSVDWKSIGDKSFIATCADDQTVRLVNGTSFDLIRVFDTKDVHGWHTLTYLAFNPSEHSCELACVTQNGHLLVWDVMTTKEIVRGKIHCGSVEGLKWNGKRNLLATCAADCNVHLLSIDM